ncbi:MAG: tetratricopeptide repeat protein [Sulfuricellaceae bacterium]
MQHHQLGQLPQAEAIYRQILQVQPNHVDALHFLGVIAHQAGKHELAIELINKAIGVNPSVPSYYNNLSAAYLALNRNHDAIIGYRKAVALNPGYAEAHHGLGNLCKEQGKLDEAVECYRKALALKPGYADVHNNLGVALLEQGKPAEAIACYRKALALKPDCADVHNNLGVAFKEQGKLDEALACYRQALLLKPDYAEVHNHMGNAFKEQGKLEDALACYRKALALKPDYAIARWGMALIQIPLVAASHEELETCRAALSHEFDELAAWFEASPSRMALGHLAVGHHQPFHLAYQAQNNRELLSRYGALCAGLMKHWQENQQFPPAENVSSEKVRIGLVSAHIYSQSVWNAIVKGWFQHLERERIELHVFYLSAKQDDETDWARHQSASFTQGGRNLGWWVEAIVRKQLDVLIFPEIGMDPTTLKLASLRLAPIQAASWGHPETTGLPTIDYYFSAEGLEPVDAQENYTEKLVSLPHLGCCYHPLPVTGVNPDLASLGVDPGAPLLLCPGVPYKYAPQHDNTLVEIARRLGRCQLIFFTHRKRELSEKLRRRLERVFAQAGLVFNDYVVFIPWQELPPFYGLLQRADVFLDTLGFSGFNTAMQAVECGLPIVTQEGRFMRGRLASGILRRLGLPELIAATEEDYVTLAVKLVRDCAYRQTVKQHIETYRHMLYDDVTPVRALENFLIDKVR